MGQETPRAPPCGGSTSGLLYVSNLSRMDRSVATNSQKTQRRELQLNTVFRVSHGSRAAHHSRSLRFFRIFSAGFRTCPVPLALDLPHPTSISISSSVKIPLTGASRPQPEGGRLSRDTGVIGVISRPDAGVAYGGGLHGVSPIVQRGLSPSFEGLAGSNFLPASLAYHFALLH